MNQERPEISTISAKAIKRVKWFNSIEPELNLIFMTRNFGHLSPHFMFGFTA